MIVLDRPYVSPFLRETLVRNRFPVVATPHLADWLDTTGLTTLPPAKAKTLLQQGARLYTNSENALNWIEEELGTPDLRETILGFKNKLKFRQRLAPLFPDYRFREVRLDELATLDARDLPEPFVIKPAVGFFSLGVHVVSSRDRWPEIRTKLLAEIEGIRSIYPKSVLDLDSFIVEEIIEGDELAFDAYLDETGKPVLLGLYHHLFSSGEDVSDRVYLTGPSVFRRYHAAVMSFLEAMARLIPARNIALHTEVRLGADGVVRPIEVNPLRFGGWCTTADMTAKAFGVNPYEAFMTGATPNWQEIVARTPDRVWAIIVMENSTGYPAERIAAFNAEDLQARFEKPLEFRPTDWKKFGVFGFLFAESASAESDELRFILQSDLREFVRLADK